MATQNELLKKDPTGQWHNRTRAFRSIDSISRNFRTSVYAYVDRVSAVEDRTFRSETIAAEIGLLTAFMLYRNGRFFMIDHINASFFSGINQSLPIINRDNKPLFLDGISSVSEFDQDVILNSSHVQRMMDDYNANILFLMESTIAESSKSIGLAISAGIAAGLSAAQIKKNVDKIIKSMQKKLERDARTSINRALTDSKMGAVEAAALLIGPSVFAFVRHKSALLPTTRNHHAERHNKVYSVIAQRRWWATGANSINCYCSVEPVLKVGKS